MNNESNTKGNPEKNGSCLEKKAQTKTFCLGACWAVAFLFLALFLFFCYLDWFMNGDPVPSSKIEKLKSKPRMEIVVDLLGKPEHVFERESEVEYVYGRQWRCLKITFDKEGNMKEYYIDN